MCSDEVTFIYVYYTLIVDFYCQNYNNSLHIVSGLEHYCSTCQMFVHNGLPNSAAVI